MEFDVKKYFEAKNINYHLPGEKNVTRGWINISCPFCVDKSWHCGVNLKKLGFSCYHCGKKGSVDYLISRIERCSIKRINSIKDQFQSFLLDKVSPSTITNSDISEIKLPSLLPKWPQKYLDFLEKKGYDSKQIITKYHLKPVGNIGKYKFRILIPIFENRQMVSFTARDITDRSDIKYRDLQPEKSIIPVKKCLYNIDKAGKNVVIVEGASDVWRIGSGAVATMTTQYSNSQIDKLLEHEIKSAFIMYDGEELATQKAYNLADRLSGFLDYVEVIEIEDGDPGELTSADIKHLRKELKL